MPDNSVDLDFISIDDLVNEQGAGSTPDRVRSRAPVQTPPAATRRGKGIRPKPAVATISSQTAGKRRQATIQRRRSGSDAAMAAIMGGLLLALAAGMYLAFSPIRPRATAPTASVPQVFKVPPQPLSVAAAPMHGQTAIRPEADNAAAPAVAAPELGIERSVADFLAVWRAAWEKSAGPQGDLGPYMECYAPDFFHGAMDKAAWAADKGPKNRRKGWIRVRVSNIRVATPVVDDTVSVTFFQEYASTNYTEASEKSLLLRKSGNSWHILGIQ